MTKDNKISININYIKITFFYNYKNSKKLSFILKIWVKL